MALGSAAIVYLPTEANWLHLTWTAQALAAIAALAAVLVALRQLTR